MLPAGGPCLVFQKNMTFTVKLHHAFVPSHPSPASSKPFGEQNLLRDDGSSPSPEAGNSAEVAKNLAAAGCGARHLSRHDTLMYPPAPLKLISTAPTRRRSLAEATRHSAPSEPPPSKYSLREHNR